MPTDLTTLSVYQKGCFQDRVTLYRVNTPKAGNKVNPATGEPYDEIPTQADTGVACQILFTQKLEDPTDIGRVRGISDRRAIQLNLAADQDIGAGWYVRDTTEGRPANRRYVYRVQDEPITYPNAGHSRMNLTTVTLDIVEHPRPEVLA